MGDQDQDQAGSGGTQTSALEKKADLFQTEFDWVLLILIAIGLVAAILYGSFAESCPAHAASGAGAPQAASGYGCGGRGVFVGILLAVFISLAALALGTLIGFLFGLPRSLTSSEFRASRQQAAAATAASAATATAAAGAPAGDAAQPAASSPGNGADVNTNLEKISDWLTTIIVGVGLTKLQEIPGSIEEFGNRVEPYFGHGGKVFGIADGLFFLIAGFFLAYVGTRVRLSLIFIISQWINRRVADGDVTQEAVRQSLSGDVIRPSMGSSATPGTGAAREEESLREADELLLSKSLSELKTPAEIIAWANAKARSGDYATALTAYKDVWGRAPFTEKMQTDYAAILAATGDSAGANSVLATLSTANNLSPDAERDARQKVAVALEAGHLAGLRTRLQQGLYRPAERGWEDSIAAGEEYFSSPGQDSDAMAHVWLACAYGQKHASLKPPAGTAATPPVQQQLNQLADKAAEQVEKALAADPSQKQLIRSLYVPGMAVGGDDDLNSLNPNPRIDTALGPPPTS